MAKFQLRNSTVIFSVTAICITTVAVLCDTDMALKVGAFLSPFVLILLGYKYGKAKIESP